MIPRHRLTRATASIVVLGDTRSGSRSTSTSNVDPGIDIDIDVTRGRTRTAGRHADPTIAIPRTADGSAMV
jgi:hypothetical protein